MLSEQPFPKLPRDMRVRLSIRLEKIFFPVDGFRLFDAMRKEGYQLLISVPPRPIAPHTSLAFAGPIAQKDRNTIDANADKGVVGVEGPSYESAFAGFRELVELIRKRLGVELEKGILFYEIVAQFEIDTNKSPLEMIDRAFAGSSVTKDASRILEEEARIFSIRLVPVSRAPDQEEWFDITIEPDLIRSGTTYDIYVVYRSAIRARVERFGATIESKILSLINEIETR